MKKPGDLFYPKISRGKNLLCSPCDIKGMKLSSGGIRVPGSAPLIYVDTAKDGALDVGIYYTPSGHFVRIMDRYVSEEPQP